jgi:hypothetical protein
MMPRTLAASLAACLVLLTLPAGAATQVDFAEGFTLIGSNPLFARGMNAAPAMYEHYLYIGSRTDGMPQHPHPGVLVVDVADPENPEVVGEIGSPDEGVPMETSRELRVWPEKKLLMVLNFQCSAILHACVSGADAAGSMTRTIKFYDLTDPAKPSLVSTYTPTRTPHEFFLWDDPARPGRALLYSAMTTSSTVQPNLIVTDISRARKGVFPEVAKWIGNDLYTDAERSSGADLRLHSLGLSADGRLAYLAYLGGGFFMLDTSDFADAKPAPKLRLATPVSKRVAWGSPGAHSAVKIYGTRYVLVTDEEYGDAVDPITGNDHGCPWGWARIVDVANEARPKVVAEFKIDENDESKCGFQDTPAGTFGTADPTTSFFSSYSAHNPTVLHDLAFVTWHSGGLRAIDLTDPTHPTQAGVFTPQPLTSVSTEDPALSIGGNKVVSWSYPIISGGLIYIVDVRNGLQVLRYTGRRHALVDGITFLEGNSNLGDAARLDGVSVLGAQISRPRPAPRPDLPATGVGSGETGVLLLVAAALIARRLRAA